MKGLDELTLPFPWSRYSRKLASRIERPHSHGNFSRDESEERGMRLVKSSAGSKKSGNLATFYWLVDKEDGSIVDVRFEAYGQTALIGAMQAASEMLVGKNYDQAKRITADLIDRHVRDAAEVPAFPPETYSHLNLVLDAMIAASEQCDDLPLPTSYAAPPAPMDFGEVLEGGYPGWDELTGEQQVGLIEGVLSQDVRPYVALDAGGVVIINLQEGRRLTIGYEGTCTSCYSAVGATLSYIQQVLRAKIHPDLVVIPSLEEHHH